MFMYTCCCLMFRSEYLFNFDRTFEVNDDIEVLKRMGLAFGLDKGQCTTGDLMQAVKMVPKSMEPYVRGMLACQLCDFCEYVYQIYNSNVRVL